MAMADIPPWLQPFLDRLAAEDRSAATRRGYRYDLLQFSAWYVALHGTLPELPRLIEHDLIAWRQHMLTLRQLKATTINRRLEAVRRLLRWAEASGTVARSVATDVKTVRTTRNRKPIGLTAAAGAGDRRSRGSRPFGRCSARAAEASALPEHCERGVALWAGAKARLKRALDILDGQNHRRQLVT